MSLLGTTQRAKCCEVGCSQTDIILIRRWSLRVRLIQQCERDDFRRKYSFGPGIASIIGGRRDMALGLIWSIRISFGTRERIKASSQFLIGIWWPNIWRIFLNALCKWTKRKLNIRNEGERSVGLGGLLEALVISNRTVSPQWQMSAAQNMGDRKVGTHDPSL